MYTNVGRGVGNVLTANCWKHGIAMYQRTVAVSPQVGETNIGAASIQVWTCPACEAERTNARTN